MLNDFVFVVDSTKYTVRTSEEQRVDKDGESIPPRQYWDPHADLVDQVLLKARETFGADAKFIAFTKYKSGSIRFFKKRGIPVLKKAGKFYMEGDVKRQIVWATIDVPQDYYVKQAGGDIGSVDLTDIR